MVVLPSAKRVEILSTQELAHQGDRHPAVHRFSRFTELSEFMARRRAAGRGRPLYSVCPAGQVDDSRGDQAVGLARRGTTRWELVPATMPARRGAAASTSPPSSEDVTPAIDSCA